MKLFVGLLTVIVLCGITAAATAVEIFREEVLGE